MLSPKLHHLHRINKTGLRVISRDKCTINLCLDGVSGGFNREIVVYRVT